MSEWIIEGYMDVEPHEVRGYYGDLIAAVEKWSDCFKAGFEAESCDDAMFAALRRCYDEIQEARPRAEKFKIEVVPHHGCAPRFVFTYDGTI